MIHSTTSFLSHGKMQTLSTLQVCRLLEKIINKFLHANKPFRLLPHFNKIKTV